MVIMVADVADIARIPCSIFSKPRSSAADVADITDSACFVFDEPRSSVADIADIANIPNTGAVNPIAGA